MLAHVAIGMTMDDRRHPRRCDAAPFLVARDDFPERCPSFGRCVTRALLVTIAPMFRP
jgi:hypothetical protein